MADSDYLRSVRANLKAELASRSASLSGATGATTIEYRDGVSAAPGISFVQAYSGPFSMTESTAFLLLNALDKKDEEISLLVETLKNAVKWFRDYADGHEAKGDTDKANRNRDRQWFCQATIDKVLGIR